MHTIIVDGEPVRIGADPEDPECVLAAFIQWADQLPFRLVRNLASDSVTTCDGRPLKLVVNASWSLSAGVPAAEQARRGEERDDG